MATSSDGVTWTAISVKSPNPFYSNWSIGPIAYGNNRFVAANGTSTMAYSSDGVTWTDLWTVNSSTLFSYTQGIVYGNGRFVAVGNGGRIAYADW
jgi:Tfp pilus assembly protein FimT